MIDAAMMGSTGSWSPSLILASFGSELDRVIDGAGDEAADVDAPRCSAAAFEKALAVELQRAGDLDPYNAGSFDPQNGAASSRAGDIRSTVLADHAAAGVDVDDAARPSVVADQRVAFGDENASWRLSADDGEPLDSAVFPHDRAAFWVGDRVATGPANVSESQLEADALRAEPAFAGRVFFNGDGRPIIPSSFEKADHETAVIDDVPAVDGDLMILPDGAVMAYDPWTATIDDVAAH